MKKIVSIVLALCLVLASCAVAFADDPTGTITISNAAKGITYKIYKLFDATKNADGAITYTSGTDGTIPNGLGDYFQKIDGTVNNVEEKEGTRVADDKLSDDAVTALKNWVNDAAKVGEADGNGSAVSFSGLGYGYYVITSNQGEGKITVVTLDGSNVSIVDKNTTEPDIDKFVATGTTTGESGTVTTWGESVDAKIGAPVQYKVEAMTSNWHTPKNSTEQKQVIDYVIGDDLAGGKLELVSIDSIKVGTEDITESINATAFPITIPWATKDEGKDTYTSLYNNGVTITIIYTAKLKDNATIDTLDGNVNTADLNWHYPNNEPHFGEGEEHLHDDAHTETYGIALVKVNKEGTKLAGAEFSLPFKAHKLEGSELNEWVYEPGEGTTTVTTTADGAIIVRGLDAGTYSITETKAPAGYNQLAAPVQITAQKISETSSVTRTDKYWKIDEDGNKFDEVETSSSATTEWHDDDIAVTAVPVLNLTGTTLPSTGGIGTTIFYILGGLLVIGAAVILVARRKAQD